MSQHDAWKSTDKQAEVNEQLHATFDRSDEYMAAYVNYCDGFETSDAYDEAFDRFVQNDDESSSADTDWDEQEEDAREEYISRIDEDIEYYGLHAEDDHDHFGDDSE